MIYPVGTFHTVPRPFAELARRNIRLGLPIPRGYRISLEGMPFYRQNFRMSRRWK